MLAELNYDLLHKILRCQDLEGIRAFYESSEELIKETIKYTNFIVECKVVLSDEELEWFESKNIKVKLLTEYKIEQFNQLRYQNGKLHSYNDLPAIIYPDGTQFWYQNGELHRLDGPAIIYPDGTQLWYQNGEEIKK